MCGLIYPAVWYSENRCSAHRLVSHATKNPEIHTGPLKRKELAESAEMRLSSV